MGDVGTEITTGHGLVGIDTAGCVRSFSPSAERLLQIARDDALGRSACELLLPEDARNDMGARFAGVVAGEEPELLGHTFRCDLVTGTGMVRSMAVSLLATAEPDPGFMLCLSADEGVLLRRGAQMRDTGLWTVDPQAETLDPSERFWELHGRSGAPHRISLENYLRDFVHTDDRARMAQRYADYQSGSEVPSVFAWRVVTSDGQVRSLVSETAAFFGEDSALEQIMGIARDVTENEGARRALLAHGAVSRALREWDEPRGGVAGLLRAVNETMGWYAGAMWRVAPDSDTLECLVYRAAPGDRPHVPSEADLRASSVGIGEGLVGRAWRSLEVEAAPADERPETAIPVVVDGTPLAVLQFFVKPGQPMAEVRDAFAELGQGMLARVFASRRAELGLSPLTDREQQVLQLAADGGAIHSVADALGIRSSTVKTHMEHIYEKLGVSDRGGAVAEGFRQGLIR